MDARLRLLCVHPHPDDESIACGGVLARYADEGIHTVVVTCTGGEAGENLAGIDLAGEDLVSHRRRELAAALDILGVGSHAWLGYRDSGMAGTPAGDHPHTFHQADLDEAAGRLAEILRRERPQVVVSDAADGTYGHPDHVKAYAVTARAAVLAADRAAPVVGAPWRVAKRYVHTYSKDRLAVWHRALVDHGLSSPFDDEAGEDVATFGTADALVTTQIDVGPWLDRKRAAMAAHASQIGPDSFFLNAPDDLTGTLFGVEQFVLEDGAPPAVRPETDLFSGLRSEGEAGGGG